MALRRVVATLCAATLSGCASFLPTYDQALFKSLSDVNTQLDKIDAAVSVVYEPAPSFGKVEGFYVAAIADLAEAKRIAEGKRNYYDGRVAGRPASLIVVAIDNCNDLVIAQMRRHRQEPLTSSVLQTFAVHETCSIPTLMVGRLKGKP